MISDERLRVVRRRAFAPAPTKSFAIRSTSSEVTIRLDAMLRRSDRDLYVHPSTRLPGAVEIEAEIARRLALDVQFATCYADLDHFKEFNDRYSYYEGDRVIRILAKILHDVVKGMCQEDGFVGHIGGDDFIFIIPMDAVTEVCAEIVSIFDTLIPFQYSEQDRRAGYFFGKDRRGQLHRVPLMTVSIGVVTNERRRFTHAAQVSALATEMKSYAKTLPGSVFSIDRRTDSRPADMPAVGVSHRIRERKGGEVNVSCPECRSVFRVDPSKVPAAGRSRALLGLRRRHHGRRWRARSTRSSARSARSVRRRPSRRWQRRAER